MKRSNSQWSLTEDAYFERRAATLGSMDGAEAIKAPFVYADRQSVTNMLTRVDLFRKVLEVQGSIVECGVHKGNSLFLYNHLSSILEPYNFNRKIIGFDTFSGFRSISENDGETIDESLFSDTSLDWLSEWADIQSANRAVSHIEKIHLVPGDAVKTIPKFVTENPHLIVALLYLDFDLYEPTKVALENFLPLVPAGGIVALDEVNVEKWRGETIALKETINLNGIGLKKFYYDPWVSYYEVV